MARTHPLQDHVAPCPFCEVQPQIADWPGRQLKVLIHKCRVVHLDRSALPSDVPAMVAEWNREVACARRIGAGESTAALAALAARMESLREDMEQFVTAKGPGVKA